MAASPETVHEHMRSALARGLPELLPRKEHGRRLIVIGGAPSINTRVDQIMGTKGKVLAVNGAAKWCVEHGIKVDYVAAMDTSLRHDVLPLIPGATYLLGSTLPPCVFDALDGAKVLLWHPYCGMGEDTLLPECGAKGPIVLGGGNIGLRSLNIGFLLGFRRFELFGIEGCRIDGEDYAYDNSMVSDKPETVDVFCAGRWFTCTKAQAGNSQDFINLMGKTFVGPNAIRLTAHGDGLIPHISKTLQRGKDVSHQ